MSYLQGDAPVQLVFLCVPQTHLPVMTTGEEDVLRGVCSQPPHLIYMALRQTDRQTDTHINSNVFTNALK